MRSCKHGVASYRRGVMAFVVVLGALSATGCGDGVGELEDELDLAEQEIRGVYTADNGSQRPISKGLDVSTQHGVNGAVAELWSATNDGKGKGCTGTLVSRYHVLTAGHCTLGTVGGFKVTFPQSSQTFHEDRSLRKVWDTRTPSTSNDGGGKDVAVITLTNPVPDTIVAKIPRVNTGDVGSFLRNNRNSNYMIVGYGDHSGERRYGSVNKVDAMMLECKSGWFSVIGLTCLRFPELWLSYYGGQAIGENGDSGGPLFGKDKKTGEYVLIGVRSGHRWWKSDPFTTSANKQVYAPIGKLGKGGVQVASLLGEDADGDGVPDHMDNCAPNFCEEMGLPMHRCFNPGQEDDDGDGIGEACDNCPQWRCRLIGDGRSCQNVEQRDFDKDGVGDICDPCPAVRTSGDYSPNGPVGEDCGCSGSKFPTCDPYQNDCEKMGAGTCLWDFGVDKNMVGGFCSMLPDMDGDGVPDDCDDCVSTPDSQLINSNLHIEQDRGRYQYVPRLGDVCDPVPIVPIERTHVPLHNQWFVPILGAGQAGVDYQQIEIHSWMGENPSAQPTTIHDPVVYRHCSCYTWQGDKLNEDDCRGRFAIPARPSGSRGDGGKQPSLRLRSVQRSQRKEKPAPSRITCVPRIPGTSPWLDHRRKATSGETTTT